MCIKKYKTKRMNERKNCSHWRGKRKSEISFPDNLNNYLSDFLEHERQCLQLFEVCKSSGKPRLATIYSILFLRKLH